MKDEAYTGPGITINSGFLNGLKAPNDSIIETIKVLEEKKIGTKINFRLKRLGYFKTEVLGCPIPIVYNDKGEHFTVPKDHLPVKLPDNIDLSVKGNPLSHQKDWVNIKINGEMFKEKLTPLIHSWTLHGIFKILFSR